MKFARFDGGKTGLVLSLSGQLAVLDIHASLEAFAKIDPAAAAVVAEVLPTPKHASWTEMIARWDELAPAFWSLDAFGSDGGGQAVPIAGCSFEPPLADAQVRVFAIGSNTVVHMVRAMKVMLNLDLTEDQILQPKRDNAPPFGFTVWPSTIVGSGAEVAPPRGTQTFDYEAECAVYVKSAGRYQENVAIWGYTAFNDYGVRDTHLKLTKEPPAGPFSFNTPKNFDSGKSCGPWVSVDEDTDLSQLRCVLKVNGEVRQDWQLCDMIYGFNDVLSYLSNSLTLRPGDMLSSGTGAGVAIEGGVDGPSWLKPGDQVDMQVGSVGPLLNLVGAW
jgi:2-keto-4-pentenoate hydratase/2-oxohepta-3-ene-1,7-dioic acid hydratase in catechol pathway